METISVWEDRKFLKKDGGDCQTTMYLMSANCTTHTQKDEYGKFCVMYMLHKNINKKIKYFPKVIFTTLNQSE